MQYVKSRVTVDALADAVRDSVLLSVGGCEVREPVELTCPEPKSASLVDVRRVSSAEKNAKLRRDFVSCLLLSLTQAFGKDVAAKIGKLVLPHARCQRLPDEIVVIEPRLTRKTRSGDPLFKKKQWHCPRRTFRVPR